MNLPKLRFPEFTEEWEQKSFYEVFDILQNNTFSRDQLNNENGIVRNIHYGDVLIKYGDYIDCQKEKLPFINLENNLTKYVENSYVRDGDIIIADTAEDYTAGKVTEICNVQNFKILSGLHTFLCRSKFEFASKFLGYKMNSGSYHSQIAPLVAGTKVYSINRKAIGETSISYPSLSEQQKIANFLSNVDSIIAAETKILNALQKKKKALMQKLFTQQLRFKSDDGKDFPAWEEKKLGECVEILDSRRKPIESKERANRKGEYPYYGASGIIDYIDDYLFEGESILLGEDGANIINRNSRLAFIATGKYWVNNHAHIMIANVDNLNYFICEYLESLDYSKICAGSAQPKLTQDVIRNLVIKRPCKEEQQKIADCLSSMDSLIQNQQKVVTTWQQRKKALLQQMFV